MRITGGAARGIQLAAPRGRAVRPTEDRVKEAMFAALGDRVRDAVVLDLFAGTGALGLEALSRGAAEVVAVERQPANIPFILGNLAAVRKSMAGRHGAYQIRRSDVRSVPGILRDHLGRFTLVLADPPYDPPPGACGAAEILADQDLPALCSQDCLLVLEHDARRTPPWNLSPAWTLLKTRNYGSAAVSFARRSAAQ